MSSREWWDNLFLILWKKGSSMKIRETSLGKIFVVREAPGEYWLYVNNKRGRCTEGGGWCTEGEYITERIFSLPHKAAAEFYATELQKMTDDWYHLESVIIEETLRYWKIIRESHRKKPYLRLSDFRKNEKENKNGSSL